MPDCEFRKAKLSDAGTVLSISRKAYGPAYLELIGELPRPASEDYRPWIERNLVWILEIRGKAVGVLVLEHDIDFWTIWSIAVDPDYQGRGLGMRLIEKAIALARAQGVQRIRLHTNSRMEGNLALYRKAGFHRIKVSPHPSRQGHELVHLQKEIAG